MREPEPFYSCSQTLCAEEVSHSADMLKVVGNDVVCESCFIEEFHEVDENGDPKLWSDFPDFVPALVARMKIAERIIQRLGLHVPNCPICKASYGNRHGSMCDIGRFRA